MFNLIAARKSFDDIEVLDLFCGTGALGLEAISRGARRATFVESQRHVLRIARQNATELGVDNQCLFLRRDALKFTSRLPLDFDLVFADPPYELDGLSELPQLVLPLLNAEGIFLLEHDRRLNFDEVAGWIKSRAYGRTIVSIFGTIQEEE
jgi:16S rRNA (guanine966-N2)-methyltransferase